VTPYCETAKSGHNAAGFRKLQKSGFSWLFLGFFVMASYIKKFTQNPVKKNYKNPSLFGFL
jgi:hypothetical protein